MNQSSDIDVLLVGMQYLEKIPTFLLSVERSLSENTFVKISLGNYKGNEVGLKNIYIKKVIIKNTEHLSFTYRYATKDIVKNYLIDESMKIMKDIMNSGFKIATLFTTTGDIQLEFLSDTKTVIRNLKASYDMLLEMKHDRNKKRHIEVNATSYLYDLNITNVEGKVLNHAQDKYKQINHYIELLKATLHNLSQDEVFEVLDMGSGKGYLTFALYDYLVNILKINAKITGVEYRADMVDLCNKIAAKNKFSNLQFVKGSIENYVCEKMDMVIALHACDTATDEAIYKGIQSKAKFIVMAPCCHKQIRNEMEKGKKKNDIDFILRHGIYLERQAEMVTDSIRALILEHYGYKTKVFEFISEAHTPKNVMIIGELKANDTANDVFIYLQKIKDAKSFFGIKKHYLEELLDMDLSN